MAFGLAGLLFSAGGQPPVVEAESPRLVLAFYYAWYDQATWTSGKVPDVPRTPYVSANRDVIVRHVDQAQGAGIDAFVLNWWGRGNQTEKNLQTLLDVAAQKGFRVAVDFDINSPFMGGLGSYADNLRHLHNVHATHSAYLRFQGRPVVFFYNVSRLSVAAWRDLRNQADPERQALWIAEGTDLRYQSVFDGHHLYSITWPNRIPPARTLASWGQRVRKYNAQNGTGKLWVATVMPGYDDRQVRPGSGFVQSRDGGEYYRQCWQAAIASRPQWVVINSFNEWPEGSYIEPSQAYGGLYLDMTREWAARFRQADFVADPGPLPAPTPKPVPPPPTPEPLPMATARMVPLETDAPQRHLIQCCNYVSADTGTGQVWYLLCPVYLSPIDQVHLIY
ncbi:MAG: endo-1,3-alpha-glucanase family glycosylhydrolase [Anaerolineae bacterium]